MAAGLPERGPVQVEFFGLPGSGKTTIAHALHGLLDADQPDIIFSPALTWDDASGFRRTSARLLLISRNLPRQRPDMRVLRLVAAARQRTMRDKAKALFNLLTVLALSEHIGRSGRDAIIDQGLLQAAWSVHLRIADEIPLQAWAPLFAGHLAWPRVFVCVRTPIVVCIDRLKRRHGRHSRMQSGQVLKDAAVWEHAERLQERLIGVLTDVARSHDSISRVIWVDGTEPPHRTAAALARQLHQGAALGAIVPEEQEDGARRAGYGGTRSFS